MIGNTGEGPKFILFEHAYLFRGPALTELLAYEYASLMDAVNETKGSKGSSRVTFLEVRLNTSSKGGSTLISTLT